MKPKLYLIVLLALIMSGANPLKAQSYEEVPGNDAEHNPKLVLKLVKARQYMQSVQLVFELSNHMEWLKHCWLGVSFYDHEGEFLYRELPLMYTSLPQGKSQRQELWLESTDIEEIGTIVLRPMLLETARNELAFQSELLRIDTDVKHQFSIEFETEE